MGIYLQHLVLLPVILTAVYAIYKKIRQSSHVDAIVLCLILLALLCNGIATSEYHASHRMDVWIYLLQAVPSAMIVPCCYLYFSHHTGRPWLNSTAIACFALVFVVLLPGMSLHLDYSAPVEDEFKFNSLNIYLGDAHLGGRNVFHVPLESVVIIIQSLVVLWRLLRYRALMVRYELRYSRRMRAFFIWCGVCVSFAIMTHMLPMKTWDRDGVLLTYFIVYAVLGCTGFIAIALNMDPHPVTTRDNVAEAVMMDRFIEQNRDLAVRLRTLLEDGDLCIRQGLVIDDVVEMLGTNRTYFTRMMRVEYGMSFTEYVHSVRLEKCKKMLIEDPDAALEDIALQTGFGSASNLSRVFKRETGMTPDSFRRKTL